jgi:hypothetical protein
VYSSGQSLSGDESETVVPTDELVEKG